MPSGKLRAYSLCAEDASDLTRSLDALGKRAAPEVPRRASRQVTLSEIEAVKDQRPVPPVSFIKGV